MILPIDYFLQENVVFIARDLIGKVIYTNINGEIVGGIITETEAYAGIRDKASHSYNNRRTNRTETMYLSGGHIYIYLCYGIHHLVNIVTNKKEVPEAVLIRAIYPFYNEELLLKRRNSTKISAQVFNGPGKVSQALGLDTNLDGIQLQTKQIRIEDKGILFENKYIEVTPRIGIDYAEEDALLPYRFVIDPKHIIL